MYKKVHVKCIFVTNCNQITDNNMIRKGMTLRGGWSIKNASVSIIIFTNIMHTCMSK